MNLRSTLENLYPTGSNQGQCITFLHKIVEFSAIGDFLWQKKNAVNKIGIPKVKLDTFKIGDIVITSEDVIFGHGAFINAIIGGKLQLSESNYSYNQKVTHARLLDPNSAKIIGVIRGTLKFALPTINYPIQLKVMILMNNQPFWNSLLQEMAQLQNWFFEASGQRIELIINYKNTTVTGWETVFTGPALGGLNVEIIKEEWYNQHILPLGDGADIVIFNMKRADWHGTVFDHPDQIELGYCYEKVGMSYPIKIFTISDQYDNWWPYYLGLSGFAKLMAHEICHGFYGIANNIGVGFDYTHNHFLPNSDYPLRPEDCFKDFFYSQLTP